MKSIPTYKLKPKCSFEESREYFGKFATDKDYSILINDDCDAYKENGEPLFFFRKRKIPSEICREAYHGFKAAAVKTENRGAAAGSLTDTEKSHVATSNLRYKRIKKDGTMSKTTRAVQVSSGIAGFFDRNTRHPYCRQTRYTELEREKYLRGVPFLQYISALFEDACPERYEAQKEMIEKTHKDFVIGGTVFTTVTVNKNFRTAYHTDAGDLKEGLGNLAVLRAGKYEGGYTVMPRYDCAFDLGSGDVCFFDVHEFHGNTEIVAKSPYERISIVAYYRENMKFCDSMEEELKRAQHRVIGDKLNA